MQADQMKPHTLLLGSSHTTARLWSITPPAHQPVGGCVGLLISVGGGGGELGCSFPARSSPSTLRTTSAPSDHGADAAAPYPSSGLQNHRPAEPLPLLHPSGYQLSTLNQQLPEAPSTRRNLASNCRSRFFARSCSRGASLSNLRPTQFSPFGNESSNVGNSGNEMPGASFKASVLAPA